MHEKVFKRINVFKGFIRTTRDYNDAVRYHLRKRQLHNRFLHGVGVVPGVTGELRVRARRSPEMAVEIRPGYAIDKFGNDVLMREVEVKRIIAQDYALPRTVYLVLHYKEEKSDFRRIRIPGFPEREGFSRVQESHRLEWTVAEPDSSGELELCRVHLTEDTTAIRDAEDPRNPGPGEIDLRHVRKAGVCGDSVAGISYEEQREILQAAIRTYTHMLRSRNIPSAGAAATSAVVMAVLNEANVLEASAYLRCMNLQREMFREVVEEASMFEPRLARRQKFRTFSSKVDTVGEVLKERDTLPTENRHEAVNFTLGVQGEGVRTLHDLIRPPRISLSSMEDVSPGEGIKILDGSEWDRVKIDSMMPRETVVVEGREWKLIDEVNVLEPDSERAHRFGLKEAVDFWKSQLTLKYPDGTPLFDDGIGHRGGYAHWDIHNVTPGMPLVIVRRMDYARGDYWCRVWINDVEAGEVPCPGEDTRYRWRNWPFYVQESFVRHHVVRVKQAVDSANRDVNFYRIWAYQPI